MAAEIRDSRLGRVRGLRHREVWFEPSGLGLTGLRTADDVLLVAAVVDGVGTARSALRRLAAAARTIIPPLTTARIRTDGDPPGTAGEGRGKAREPQVAAPAAAAQTAAAGVGGVEVSASFVGRRNYTRYEIEDAVGAELARRLGMPYHSRSGGAVPPDGCVAWRVTIEGDRALIAVRIADRPLHRRAYKAASIRGTLHPPVAAAMAALARLDGARTVLDPCCGAGTVLIEAAILAPQARLLGLDHDPAAIAAARANACRALGPHSSYDLDGSDTNATPLPAETSRTHGGRLPNAVGTEGSRGITGGPPGGTGRSRPTQATDAGTGGRGRPRWVVGDAGRVPVAGGSVDRVLVNPPWGRQVPPAGELAREPGRLWREIRRVLAPGGLVVALLHDEPPGGFEVVERVTVSLAGRRPVVAVLRR